MDGEQPDKKVTNVPPAPPEPAPPERYGASVYPYGEPLPEEFVAAAKKLEALLGFPIWLLVQNGEGPFSTINLPLYQGFQEARADIEFGQPVGLLIESAGGDAHFAYRLARMFQKRASKFTVIVPQYAKSAATLLALGARDLIVGRDAELGPLDVQVFDPEREDYGSALNAVQSLERLNAFGMMAVDQLMILLVRRTGKKTATLLPQVLDYVANFVRPLLEKIDTVDYTGKSRELKVAEEYAIRLMRENYPWAAAKRIAGAFVEKYPTHGFVIDADEASLHLQVGDRDERFGLGLNLCAASDEVEAAFAEMTPFLNELTILGRLEKIEK